MLKLSVAAGMTAVLVLAQEERPDKRLREAAMVLEEIMGSPDRAIPKSLLEKARCVIVVPGMKKGAFVVGGVYGRGFVTCRNAESWKAPAGIRLAGGSFGLQLGAQSTDVVMLIMNQTGVDRLLSDKFTIGVEASAAVGPIGRDTIAATDAVMRAEILSWSRSHGVFAGVSLDGTVVQGDRDENEKLYGRPLSTREIVEGNVPPPPAAHVLLSVLEKYVPGS